MYLWTEYFEIFQRFAISVMNYSFLLAHQDCQFLLGCCVSATFFGLVLI